MFKSIVLNGNLNGNASFDQIQKQTKNHTRSDAGWLVHRMKKKKAVNWKPHIIYILYQDAKSSKQK